MKSMKLPKTFTEQIDILRARNLEFGSEIFATDFLRRVNYYRFSGYLLAFKQEDGTYKPGTFFEDAVSLYNFDHELRSLMMKAFGIIETEIKTMIAYQHAHKYGPLGYEDSSNFNTKHNRAQFEKRFEDVKSQRKKSLFVSHHLKSYSGKLPIWVAVEIFNLGMLSYFYADLRTEDKKLVASEFGTSYDYFETWLHSLTVLRNTCAHHDRLYNIKFDIAPKLPKEFAKYANPNDRYLFRYLYMLKLLFYNNKDKWNNSILADLVALVQQYSPVLTLESMGLPVLWNFILKW